jgi:hypothetical protein
MSALASAAVLQLRSHLRRGLAHLIALPTAAVGNTEEPDMTPEVKGRRKCRIVLEPAM